MSDEAIISCRHLAKTFGQGSVSVDVLRDVSFELKPGERVAIVGSSGAGKSTLLHLLGGLDSTTGGEIRVGGKDLTTLNAKERGQLRNQMLGFVYQFHHLLPEFSALENVAIPLMIRGESPAFSKAKARIILDKVGLSSRLTHKPGELSGGERQRVAVARALVTAPKCVLADEPTGNLDYKNANQIFKLLMELNVELNTSLIVVTHELSLARQMDRVLTLANGTLSEQ
jgi:lipoprotein-releasing system ATP-binding protein